MQENLNIIEQAANITSSALELQEKYIKDTDTRFSKMEKSVNNNTLNIEIYTQFFGILTTVLLTAQNHQRIQTKLNHIFSGETKYRLFEIINYVEFLKTMEAINEKLKPDLTLPKLQSMEKNNFIETHTEFNDTHLMLSVDLPVIQRGSIEISELIPIPIRENNTLYILDTKTTTYLLNGSNIQLFPDDVRKSLCKAQEKITICNTLLENYVEKIPTCIENLLTKQSDAECNYKEIQYRNYFIQISEIYLYAYITDPIKIVKNCRGKNQILELNESQKISLPKGCHIYKYLEKSKYNDGQTTMVDKTSKYNRPKINLEGQINELLTIIPLWNKYELQFIEPKGRMKRIKKEVPLQREKIENTSSNSSLINIIPDFKGMAMNMGFIIAISIIAGFLIILSLFLMKALIMKLLTDCSTKQ